jgi:microcystin-dependent protein
MSTPGIAVPGTVVPAGSLTSPGGAQGVQGLSADAMAIGSILMYGSTTAPAGWMICDGSPISRTTYPALFSLIGTTFGPGDGSTTFNLPDLRSRVGVGAGQGSGLSSRVLAATGGEETHLLSVTEIPSHTHPVYVHFNAGSGTVTNAAWNQSGSDTSVTSGTTGGGASHNTMPPFLVLAFIIKVSMGGGPTAQAPIADSTQSGLLRQVSGIATDYIDGTNNSHAMGPVIVGAVAGTSAPPSAILVPRYAAHPDQIWTPMGAFDDHFAGSTLAGKWTQNPGPSPVAAQDANGQQIYVSDSRLCINGIAGANNDIAYVTPNVFQSLPNGNPFTLTLACNILATANATNTASAPGQGSQGGILLQIANAAGSVARFVLAVMTNLNTTTGNRSTVYWGPNAGSGAAGNIHSGMPRYFRWVYTASNAITLYGSMNGKHWMVFTSLTGAQTGFSTSPPTQCTIGAYLYNYGSVEISVDWIKFTNP